MTPYPILDMPAELSVLLRINVQMTQKDQGIVQKYFYERPGLIALVMKMTGQSGEQLNFEKEFKAQGWKPFRNRLVSLFIEKKVRGEFPESDEPKLVSDIVKFEDELESIFIGGYSRAFLLGLYYKFWQIEARGSGVGLENNPLENVDRTFDVLKKVHSRVLQIDYLFIILQHLGMYLTFEKLDFYLSQGESYQDLYSHLNPTQQKELMENLLNYSCSVNDMEFFTSLNV